MNVEPLGPAAGLQPGAPLVAPMTTLRIENWHPARLNQLLGHWRRAHRLKLGDRNTVCVHAYLAGLEPASMKRRVDLLVTLGPGQRSPDRDAWWKSLLDALVHAKQLVDDSPRWCVPGSVTYDRAKRTATTIYLTDL